MLERFDSILDEVQADETMRAMWDKYRTENFFVGELSWDDVNRNVKKLKEVVLGYLCIPISTRVRIGGRISNV